MAEIILLLLLVGLAVTNAILLIKSTSKVGSEDALGKATDKISAGVKDEIARNREEISQSLKANREELTNSLKNFGDSLFNQVSKLSLNVDGKLKSIQEDNSKKLEEMRKTVDEKLHETLEKRLGESFKIVSERLELVQRGLGEMQNLAVNVGDLKKVLANVKTRGVFGEIQLEKILEQIFTSDQYKKNVITKKGSNMPVEFAIKFPGKDDAPAIFLPIDSKFPMDKYHNLVDAYEVGDAEKIETASKDIENTIKKFAKDIFDKYLDPPTTTDFAIMFLPVEGLYAEIARRNTLFESLRRDYKVVISGPSTLVATLNALQMGFRTLAIEKRTSEVWQLLSTVKEEFDKFGTVLEKAKVKINEAGKEIEELVGTRTRMIQSKLRKVQELPSGETPKLPTT